MSHKQMILASIAAVGIAAVAPSIALAQRGAVVGMHTAGTPARAAISSGSARRTITNGVRLNANGNRTAARVNGRVATGTRHGADAFGFGGGYPLTFQDLLGIMPTDGFNWQFVNSINQDLAMKAFIDPVTQVKVAEAERLLRSTGGAFGGSYTLGGGGYYYPPEPEENAQAQGEEQGPVESHPAQGSQPQIIVLQQAPQPGSAQNQPESSAQQPQQEIPDGGDFTLVLHSGAKIQAVAFTHSKDKIVYITPEGARSTIAISELDADATVRINQERGTPLQLPL